MPQVSVPIIDQLVHPSLGYLSEATIPGAFTGNGTLAPPQNPLLALTYGIAWDFFTIPAQFGLTLGDPILYQQRILQLACEYQLLSGSNILVQVEEIYFDGGHYLWEEPLPYLLHYYITPGCVLNFRWLQT